MIDTIERSIGKPIVFVGASGVGKSVLIETQVIPTFVRDGWKAIHFEGYDNLESQAYHKLQELIPDLHEHTFFRTGTVSKAPSGSSMLVVFDQFEQFLTSRSSARDIGTPSAEWFRNFITSLVAFPNVRCVIVVRKEWYFDLRFLEDIVPSPRESFELTGIDGSSNLAARAAVTAKMQAVLEDDHLVGVVLASLEGDDHTLLPVEVQIVGLMLENIIRHSTLDEAEYRKRGGKEGIIEEYFRAYLDACPDRGVALRILCALSIETRLKGHLSLDRLSAITHKSTRDVRECLAFLRVHELVTGGPSGNYEVTHDYLALKFHELSGTELDPVERDNIVFFWDETRATEPPPLSIPASQRDNRWILSDYCLLLVTGIVSARLFSPLFGLRWGSLDPLAPFQDANRGIDPYYLPMAITHLSWFAYVTFFYRRFFVHLQEGKSGRVLTHGAVLVSALSVICGTFAPHLWLTIVGIGGLMVGLKLLQVAWSARVSNVSRRFFARMGIQTVINVSVVILLGVASVAYIGRMGPSSQLARTFLLVSYAITALMTYWVLAVWPEHVSPSAASKMLGLADRMRMRRREGGQGAGQ